MNDYLRNTGIAVGVLVVVSLIIGIISSLSVLGSFRIVFGSAYVLFLPGFLLTFIFFPLKKERGIDWIERVALSFALSIAIVPLVVFYLNLIGIGISAMSSFFIILVILLIEGGVIYWRQKR